MEKYSLSPVEQSLIYRLDEDLLAYADEDEPMEIYHFLIKVSLYRPITTEQIDKINSQYSDIRDKADQAMKEKRFDYYLGLIQRGYRLQTFKELVPLLTDRQYWELLAYVWIDTEFPHRGYDQWSTLFSSKRPQRKFLMNEEERRALTAMPRILNVYRGGLTAGGQSWTLSEELARRFANRFDRDGKHKLFRGTVPKSQVYAYFKSRKEEEIVVDPRLVSPT